MIVNLPPSPPKLSRQWTGDKIQTLVSLLHSDIGKFIYKQVLYNGNINIDTATHQANINADFRALCHYTGARPHRSTVILINGMLFERRHFVRSREIAWFPIYHPF